ncbi:MAG: hypothetical protein M3R38_31110 [Actinomycetota bacterium]|nr:hypothetical protein [Actinomycetota bacterium]
MNARFAALLADDFGIPAATVLDALEGEPQKQAISICEWAFRTDNPARALTSWARKHDKGRCRRAARPADRSSRRHGGRTERPRDDRRDTARPSDTSRRDESLRGVLDPARVRANVERMGG